jgi:hypothetical protein
MKLLEDREYRLSVGNFGKDYVEKEHNMEKEVRRVEAMYLDVIGGSK